MEVIITKGQIEDIEVIAQFQVDIAMESEGTLLDKDTVTKGSIAASIFRKLNSNDSQIHFS